MNWFDLALNGNPAKRERANAEENVDDFIRTETERMTRSVEQIRAALYFKGMLVTDVYHQMAKENAFSKDETHITPRVRMDPRYNTPSFYWERLIRHAYDISPNRSAKTQRGKGRSYDAYVRRKGAKTKEKMRVVLSSQHIRINRKTLAISLREFDREPQWARLAAEIAEKDLVRLRQTTKQLSNVNRALQRLIAFIVKVA